MSLRDAQQQGTNAADALLLALEAVQVSVSRKLSALVSTLAVDSRGRLVNSPANTRRLAEIIAEAKATMFDDQFIEEMTDYLGAFDSITQEVFDAFDEFEDEETLADTSRAFKASVAEFVTNPDSYGGSLWQPVTNTVLLGIATRGLLGDTVQSVGEVAANGGITRAVESEVSSVTITLQRTATQVVAQAVGAEFFLYQGRPIKTTRVFCEEREGKVWHIEEIRQWGRDAANGVDLDGSGNPGWAGMVEGTNADNIFVYLGGWYGGRSSCRHVLLPLALRDVPADDLARMRSKGLVN